MNELMYLEMNIYVFVQKPLHNKKQTNDKFNRLIQILVVLTLRFIVISLIWMSLSWSQQSAELLKQLQPAIDTIECDWFRIYPLLTDTAVLISINPPLWVTVRTEHSLSFTTEGQRNQRRCSCSPNAVRHHVCHTDCSLMRDETSTSHQHTWSTPDPQARVKVKMISSTLQNGYLTEYQHRFIVRIHVSVQSWRPRPE